MKDICYCFQECFSQSKPSKLWLKSKARINMGYGTLSGVLSRMEKDGLISLSEDDGRIAQQIVLIIVYLYLVYNSVEAAISIGTLRKTLSEGRPINYKAPWKRKRRLRKIVSSIFILLLS